MSKRVVLGTAGHIDHGKTSLVRALTGIDTDRLKEEKERGITIELGFAHLILPGGVDLAIVDVPGHERFVRNMVAGASGIDLVMLVVAADEGVMPQTREHLDICSLLDIRQGLVALTKVDMVDEELAELARDDVSSAVVGTFLEDAPIVPVSAVRGDGLEALKEALERLVVDAPQRSAKGAFRLPLDRVFTMKGFGTVVTGTVVTGTVRRDDELELLPAGIAAKVRGIQVHGGSADRALAGQRVALNLGGVDVAQLHRGNTAVQAGSVRPTYMVDTQLRLLPDARKPMKSRARMRLHLGTQEVPVVVAFLGRDELLPGEACYAQLRASERFVACPGDHFVLRSFSPAATVGGGRILDQHPRRHRGLSAAEEQRLGVLDRGEPEERLGVFLQVRRFQGLDPVEAQTALGVPLEEARRALQLAVQRGEARVSDRKNQRHHHTGLIAELEEHAETVLAGFHREHPLKKGIGLQELRTKFRRHVPARLVEFTLERLAEDGRIVIDGETVRRSDFQVQLSADDAGLRNRLIEFVVSQRYSAPTAADIAAQLGEGVVALQPVLDYLISQGRITRTKEGFFFDSQLLVDLARRVVKRLHAQGEIGVADLKDLTDTTRKYTIPLMEYLDSNRITLRKGDVRVLGPKGKL